MKQKILKEKAGELLLTRGQLAARWNCCKETVRRMQMRGELPAII